MSKIQATETEREKSFKEELVSQMLNLATSGFGLVAALAWNDAIQSFVKEYIEKFFPVSQGVIFRFFYAALLTVLVVLVVYQLSKLAAKLHRHHP